MLKFVQIQCHPYPNYFLVNVQDAEADTSRCDNKLHW